jgi:hypothetical protein
VSVLLSDGFEHWFERVGDFAVVIQILEAEKPLKSIDHNEADAIFLDALRYPSNGVFRCGARMDKNRIAFVESHLNECLGDLWKTGIKRKVGNRALNRIAAKKWNAASYCKG